MHQSMASFVSACNKRVCRASKKLKNYYSSNDNISNNFDMSPSETPRGTQRSGLTGKVSFIPFLARRKPSESTSESDDDEQAEGAPHTDEALWRRTILMGEKCEPLDFSGVIYYDSQGKMLDHVPPRTPRHTMIGSSPMPSFLFPVSEASEKNGKGGDQ